MPSRFCFYASKEDIIGRFPISEIEVNFYPYYNIKPTNRVLGLINKDGIQAVRLRWGFVKGNKFFKARSESVHEKNMFKKAFKERRCMLLLNGFFEWKKGDGASKPFYFKMKNGDLFGIAGVYNVHEDDDGSQQYQFAVLTTEANSLVEEIFHRMPVMFERKDELKWLDPETSEEELHEIMKPYNADEMESYQVPELPARKDNGPDTIKRIGKETSLDDWF